MAPRQEPVSAVGKAVRDLRTAIGWSQRELARRAGVSQSMVCVVERGSAPDLTFSTAAALVGALGGRLVIDVDAPYLGDRERQRDPAHAMLSGHVVGRLRRAGWHVRTEVEIGGDRSRGWIDVLAVHPASGVMLIIEIKTEIRDLGQIERSLGWYEREAWAAARRMGWQPSRAIGCLLLLATEANDARVVANRVSIQAGFPLRARDLGPIVAGETVSGRQGRAIAMVDPRSRRRAWCGALRLDGRRSPAPYLDYASLMRATGRAR
ncbi:MAG: helix-turn-helix domain-containing protein [Chloroflexi bacterium]|nr:helix-turn-helix domain-containing protein [Chloroflexota bacterium]